MNNYKTIERNGVFIYLMEIPGEEPEIKPIHLNEDELKRFYSIKHQQKRKEFSTTRKLKQLLFGETSIQYNESGSPYILNYNNHLGISHAHNTVCIAQSSKKIGVDLELISDKAKRVAKKFCSEDEKKLFDINSSFDMSLLWSFKESLYKISDRKELIFLEDLKIEKVNHQFIGNVRCKNGFEKYYLHFEVHNMLILTFTTDEIIQSNK